MGRKLMIGLAAGLVALCLGAGLLWKSEGHAFIQKLYDGKGPAAFSDVIQGQAEHPVEHYFAAADQLARRLIMVGVSAVLALLGLLLVLKRENLMETKWKLVYGLPFLGLFAFAHGYYLSVKMINWRSTVLLLTPLIAAMATLYLIQKGRGRMDRLVGLFTRHTEEMDALPKKHLHLWVLLASALTLYLELMIIRFHSSYFQLFAYFKNVSLFSCFLGLGIGYATSKKKFVATPLVFPVVALQIIGFLFIRLNLDKRLLQNPISEQWSLGLWSASGLVPMLTVYGFIIFVFTANALLFVPLGQLTGRLMSRQNKLEAYGWNLLGSLAGILLFTGISFLWAPPVVWVALAFLGLYPFVKNDARSVYATLSSLVLVVFALVLPWRPTEVEIYSPYQILTVEMTPKAHPTIKTSNTYFQKLLDLSHGKAEKDQQTKWMTDYYELPYFFKQNPKKVLVVGSGTGNDVAAAVRRGAGSVDAVEIDPTIIELGKKLHPEKPYHNPKVRVHANDARAFIRNTDTYYDLIVYGLLDSHTLLSGKSGGIRLDSYVYTREAFEEARAKLHEDGILVLSFAIMGKELGQKIYLMLQAAFDGTPPLVYRTDYDGGVTYVAKNKGPLEIATSDFAVYDITDQYSDASLDQVDLSTDNWPFFYMPTRTYPLSYMLMVCLLVTLSALYIFALVPRTGGGGGFSPACFFLGAGFMLVEAKGITELALVYGTTWVVISIVIVAILCAAYLANLLVMKGVTFKPILFYGALWATLLMGYGLTFMDFGTSINGVSRILYTAALTLPLFFSGFAFSSELKHSPNIGVALSANLMGAMLGGFFEYNSMYFGFRSLYLFALAMYLLAFFTSKARTS